MVVGTVGGWNEGWLGRRVEWVYQTKFMWS